MKTFRTALKFGALLTLVLGGPTGCESTDDNGGGGAVYYGSGFYDPWYYDGYYTDYPDYIVTPPELDRPRPEHPIARPPSGMAPRPMPTMPSMPRGGGGRR
jgi:hypothetical protein